MSFIDKMVTVATWPVPLRSVLFRKLLSRYPIGSYRARLSMNAVDRPHYGWFVYHAARQAKGLGYKAVTVIEFGVAGGNGLVCLCGHKEEIQNELGIEIQIVGFDTGAGLPASQ